MSSKRIKYPGVNLPKEAKDLFSETCMMNKINDTDTWKYILCSWTGIINIIKVTTTPKASYRFNEIPIKLSVAFFTELVTTKKNCMEIIKTKNSQSTPEREKESWRLPELTKYCKATVIKTVYYTIEYYSAIKNNLFESALMNG